ncbi:MAG: hypothetical protein Q9225_000543 [Loekoesia sp. 1 TL-2023]
MAQVQVRTALKRKFKQAAPSTPTVETAQQINISQRLQLAQQQSFKFVYTFLHSSLAYLAYLRHLFPEDCFKTRSFEAICRDAEARFRDSTGNEEPEKKRRRIPETDDPSNTQLDLKVLVQDSHPSMSIFLGWLVSGSS